LGGFDPVVSQLETLEAQGLVYDFLVMLESLDVFAIANRSISRHSRLPCRSAWRSD
jgi:hypothetical protein